MNALEQALAEVVGNFLVGVQRLDETLVVGLEHTIETTAQAFAILGRAGRSALAAGNASSAQLAVGTGIVALLALLLVARSPAT